MKEKTKYRTLLDDNFGDVSRLKSDLKFFHHNVLTAIDIANQICDLAYELQLYVARIRSSPLADPRRDWDDICEDMRAELDRKDEVK